MATLTKDRYRMSHQMNLLSIGSATSLLGSQGGLTLSDSQSGPQIERSGPDHALASPSQQQGNASLTTIPGISGRLGSSSSRSAALTLSLANRLRVVTDSLGSTLFRLTWSQRVTPSGRSIFALRASAHRTSGSGCTSAPWATPKSGDVKGTFYTRYGQDGIAENRSHMLQDQAQLASWPTPRSTEAGHSTGNPERAFDGKSRLEDEVFLTSWSTPSSRDWKDTGDLSLSQFRKDGKERNDTVPRQAALVTASGPTPNGSPAGTGKRGQLNPRFSLWLMGFPEEWASCGERAMQSLRRSRKRS